MNPAIALLRDGLDKWKVPLSDRQIGLFAQFCDLLMEGAKRLSLTSLRQPDEITLFHFLDSLAPVAFGIIGERGSLIDVGSGAGFPGLPIAIMKNEIAVTLCEARKKKVEFLNLVVHHLGLKNVRVLWERAETAARSEAHRECYDIAVSRAFGPVAVTLECTVPFVVVGGRVAIYGGPTLVKESELMKGLASLLGGRLERLLEYALPLTDRRRTLAVVVKEGATDRRYPRRAGIPKKRPLRPARKQS
ncbi:MAG: 16S rRNA (guanine(527)-N(7))-methyltransferase RsmG [Armatimonadetes bacterium]|nr:16S rRNA (guanine(527)-N(7))-methyltransferase RsmG [Armatimonadota bacterium]MDW8122195.1 16S rRNA (guanine(527)-N(7))-methyltransferase RsmG [Armatimonadota bacterium]